MGQVSRRRLAWIYRQFETPPGWRRRVMVSGAAILAMVLMRVAAEPIIGADISFTAFFPMVILATLSIGIAGGAATITAGSFIALIFSVSVPLSGRLPDAGPRLIVWLISSSLVASVALALRSAMIALRERSSELETIAIQLETVIGELEHRGNNALSIIQALSRETARQSVDVIEYEKALSNKMQALAASYAFLTRRRPTPILLGSLVAESLTVFGSGIKFDGGPAVWIQPEASVALVLVLHELATAAAKHGALFMPGGTVALSWAVEGDSFSLLWSEHSGLGRSVLRSHRLGSRLIQRAFEGLPEGSISEVGGGDGMSYLITLRCGKHGPVLRAFTDAES